MYENLSRRKAMRSRDYQPGEDVPGTVYKVLRLIGAGGMGTVYDVEDTTIGKRYVLKTLHPRLGAREDLARRIQNEARTLARLHHPNIVEVITAGVTADDLKLPYYLMERLSGQSLRLVLEKKGQLELSHAYHIGIDLLDALDHAHDKGVIHRDVKPDNIFLHRTLVGLTVTKLLDFGIVSMLDTSHLETAGRFLGTLRYAAPEQLRGDKPTAKTDVYSAALVLYEIIAGRGPFDEEGDAHRIAAAHINKYPPPVSQFARVPRELDVLLMAALAKNPEARPRDAFSFAASLRNLKRRVDDARPREATENRVTAAAVISPESVPALPVPEPSPSAPLAVAPSSPASSPEPVGPAKTTLIGMPSLAPPPSLPATSPSPSTAAGDARPRPGPTASIGFDTLPMPQHGTEPLPGSRAALGEADTEIQWPQERVATPSDEPQVHSLVAWPPRRPVRPIALGVAGVAAVAVMAWALIASVRHASESVDGRAAAVSPVSTAPPAPRPVVAVAQPTIAPPQPGLVDVSAPVASVSVADAAPVRPAPAASSASRSSHPKAAASSTPPHLPKVITAVGFAGDRPGPGF
jgi:serine/threonine protein kinase